MNAGPQMPEWIGLVKSHESGMTMEQLAHHRAAYWEARCRRCVRMMKAAMNWAGVEPIAAMAAKEALADIGPLPPENPT